MPLCGWWDEWNEAQPIIRLFPCHQFSLLVSPLPAHPLEIWLDVSYCAQILMGCATLYPSYINAKLGWFIDIIKNTHSLIVFSACAQLCNSSSKDVPELR